MKNITIAGNLTKNAEIRHTDKNDATSFSVAVNHGYGDKKTTMYFDCTMWGTRGTKVAPYLAEGSKVCVTGDLTTREHNGKTYLGVTVSELTILESKRNDMDQTNPVDDMNQAPALDDSIPF